MKRVFSYIALALILAEVLLVLVSWLLSATMLGGMRSLLSSEGLRWYAGHYTDLLLSPLLAWLLLLSMAAGCMLRSGVLGMLKRAANYRERVAASATSLFLIIYIGVVLLLAVVPHAVLRSATGGLWPSPFSAALVPLLSFGVVLASSIYGLISGRLPHISHVFQSLVDGLSASAPLLLLYVLFIQFYESLRFCFAYPSMP